MCIAIYVPAGIEIPFEHLEIGQKHNPDGCGMAWVENGQVQIFKSMKFSAFTEKYYEVQNRLGLINMLIHFRITSRGVTNEEMCHPFMAGPDIAIIHNGTISAIKAAETTNGDSDTKVLAEKIMANLPEGWESNAAVHRLLEDFIGWSKICILNSRDEVYIVNETSGFWDKDIWYSNKSYISYAIKSTHNNNSNTTNNVTVYTPPDKTTTTSNTANRSDDKFWTDYCDHCQDEFQYDKLNAWSSHLICDTCLAKAQKANTKAISEVSGAKVYRGCGCCRTLVDKTELWHVELEFSLDIDKHPEQFDEFQKVLLIPHKNYSDIFTTHLCEECYTKVMTGEIGKEVLHCIMLLDAPEKYEEEEVRAIISSLS